MGKRCWGLCRLANFNPSPAHQKLSAGLKTEFFVSWCDQKETGLCDQKENNDLSPLPQESGLIISPVASAEDRALRGRNLSAG